MMWLWIFLLRFGKRLTLFVDLYLIDLYCQSTSLLALLICRDFTLASITPRHDVAMDPKLERNRQAM